MKVIYFIIGVILMLNSGYCLWRMMKNIERARMIARDNGIDPDLVPSGSKVISSIHGILFIFGLFLAMMNS